ncbi:sensor histidine kinase [Hymenobacter lutimineralis]|nr:sensor histidine kinase [Hymenobacter lutimineralis]
MATSAFPTPRVGLPSWLRLTLRDALVWSSMLALSVVADRRFLTGDFPWAVFHEFLVYLLLPTVGAVYVNHLVLVPRLLDQGRYFQYLAALLIWSLLLGGILKLVFTRFYAQDSWGHSSFNVLFVQLLAMGVLMVWRSITQRRTRLRTQLLERDQQLRLLEAQVNPHFLFNTLNSLYALSLTQSPQTPDMLLALSGLMRYQLDSTQRPRVPLQEELDYLRSYTALQALRLGARCPLVVELPEPEQAAGFTVPPLLFLALIENAFTYGTRRAQGSFVTIKLTLEAGKLHLSLRNALPPATDAGGGAGTGLANTRQRLALLYPDRHTLHAEASATEFCTDLYLAL